MVTMDEKMLEELLRELRNKEKEKSVSPLMNNMNYMQNMPSINYPILSSDRDYGLPSKTKKGTEGNYMTDIGSFTAGMFYGMGVADTINSIQGKGNYKNIALSLDGKFYGLDSKKDARYGKDNYPSRLSESLYSARGEGIGKTGIAYGSAGKVNGAYSGSKASGKGASSSGGK